MCPTTPRAPFRGRRAVPVLLLLLGAALGMVLGVAVPQAAAHAALRSSDPAEDSVLKTAPKHVTLTFSEGIGISGNSIRVFDPTNHRVDKGEPGRVDGEGDSTVRVALRDDLPRGTFTVAWRGVSADSHPVAGAFVFSVGKPSGTSVALPDESPGGGIAGALYGAVRYIAYGGYAVLAGVSAFVLFCWPRGAGLRPLRRLLAASWWAMVVASAAQLALRGPYTSADGGLGAAVDPSEIRRTLGTEPGAALVVRLLLLAAAGGLLLLISRWSPGVDRMSHRQRRGLAVTAALLAVGLAASWAATEHASVGMQVPLSIPLDVLHLLAVAVWLGGLAALLAALFLAPGGEPIPASRVNRFSRLAFASVVTLAVTGLYQSWRQVGSWDALLNTSYGQLLMVKLAAVGLMLSAANYSRGWTARLREAAPAAAAEAGGPGSEREHEPERETATATATVSGPSGGSSGPPEARPAASSASPSGNDSDSDQADEAAPAAAGRRGLRRSVGAEVAVAVLVLAVTTLLTGTQPGRAATEEAAAAPAGNAAPALSVVTVTVPFDTGGANGKGKVYVTLDPGAIGANDVQVAVLDASGGFVSVPEVRVTFTMPKRGIGPLDAGLKDIGGYWSSDSVRLPFPGAWKMSVTVRTSDIDQVTETKSFKVR